MIRPENRTRFRPALVFFGIALINLISISYAQEYGYLLAADTRSTVWWAEGAYKVLKDAPPDENQSFWVTVHVPAEASAGEYRSSIRISTGDWKREIPVVADIWDFALPNASSIRSSLGLPIEDIRRYHNLETREEIEQVTDLYYQNFRDHRLAPTSPLDLYPMRIKINGLYWTGGEFSDDRPCAGRRALQIVDASVSAAKEAAYQGRIPVEPDVPYVLSWHSRAAEEKQRYTVLVECFSAGDEPLPPLNVLKVFEGSLEWKPEVLEIKGFPAEAKTVGFRFFPTFRDEVGSFTGTACFDDIVFRRASDSRNLLAGGDMETDLDSMSVEVDFREFDAEPTAIWTNSVSTPSTSACRGWAQGLFTASKGGSSADSGRAHRSMKGCSANICAWSKTTSKRRAGWGRNTSIGSMSPTPRTTLSSGKA